MSGEGQLVEVREPGRATLRLLVTDRLAIGRSGDGLLLADERLSRQHCELEVTGGGLVVRDRASSNGTFVNGRRVEGDHPLQPGDEVRLGDTTITVVGPLVGWSPAPRAAVAGEADDEGVDLRTTLAGDALRTSMVGGTITLVFSDIVDSTVRNGTLGDRAWLELLRRHTALLDGLALRHGGTQVKALGDGFIFTFPSARRGLSFAVEAQRALAAERAAGSPAPDGDDDGLHVRIGVHTGEVLHLDGDVFGRHVHLAARVASAAGADEIVASELVRQLVAPMGEFAFGVERVVALKGFDRPVALCPVRWDGSAS